ncbi:asparagine synthase (glutamine-hydrolyzing) [Candidatus Atribacteria bacterium HGW-Atribacteria-1]|nr:MAG: asparagine synthase (glutamine-hydrolyzing) [Candidatus Atribacteria bacterium HGW-Atribacteria-1]
MCGIAGRFNFREELDNPMVIKDMCDVVAHRGPDDAGYVLFPHNKNGFMEFTDNNFLHKNINLKSIESPRERKKIYKNKCSMVLGHRRLAIIDLSEKAHQPMSDSSGRFWISYNGEVYNFKSLRTQLEKKGYTFKSESDVEVVLNSYKEWGTDCLRKFNGMFAFALWDSLKGKLVIARDRFGVIPIYYCIKGTEIIFGSEIKSIVKSGNFQTSVDSCALNEYFTFQNVLSDRTLFKDVKILAPGSYLEINKESIQSNQIETKVKKYWDYNFSSENYKLSLRQTEEKIKALFEKAVKRQLVSDVPVGSYLSGGVDTGSIVSAARKHFTRLFSFTVGFDMSSASGLEIGFDERKYSEIMANIYKTEHYEAVLHAGDMEDILPELIWHLEDLRVGQCYPDYYASRLASKFVKVVLSGTGSDEIFGGYPWRYYRGVGARNKSEFLEKYYSYWQRLIADDEKEAFFVPGIFRDIKDHSTFDIFSSLLKSGRKIKSKEDCINAAMEFEIKTFLHGLFVVTNKISMAHSLETRVPFMDNELVDFAMSIPSNMKLRSLKSVVDIDENALRLKTQERRTNEGKYVFRRAMRGSIPKEILEKSKQGFSAPDASWFKGESIEYIKDILLSRNSRIYEYINRRAVQDRLNEHMAGKKNNRLFIWSCLSFEWWLRRFLK